MNKRSNIAPIALISFAEYDFHSFTEFNLFNILPLFPIKPTIVHIPVIIAKYLWTRNCTITGFLMGMISSSG